MATLYENLDALCKQRGIKGGKMCTDLGISKSLMTDLKMGRKKTIAAETAQKIAAYFDVTVGYLLGKEDTKKEPADPLVYMSVDRQAAVYELFAERIKALDETEGFVIVRSGVKKNFFPRLANHSLSRIEKDDLFKVASYLGVSQELDDILTTEDEASEFVKNIMSKIDLIPIDKRKLVNDWLDTIITR